MSAEHSARSVSRTEGVDKVRALQRLLYRSAKQDPTRRFQCLFLRTSLPRRGQATTVNFGEPTRLVRRAW